MQPTGKATGNQVRQAEDAVLKAFEAASKGMPADQLKVLANQLVVKFTVAADMAGCK